MRIRSQVLKVAAHGRRVAGRQLWYIRTFRQFSLSRMPIDAQTACVGFCRLPRLSSQRSSAMVSRILVLSASVGAGHLRAAQAVELALRQLDPAAVVKNVDVLELTNPLFRRPYGKAYLDLVNKAPHVLGYFYDLLDRPASPPQPADRLRFLAEKLNLRKLQKFLRAEPWDVIVNTHFLPH